MMRRRFRRPDHSVPELNMASLPDLIFTVLFFFMIVTHMRDVEKRVQYQVPSGTEVEKAVHKSSVAHIYIGKPMDGSTDDYCIQLNNQIATTHDIARFIEEERRRMSPEDQELARHNLLKYCELDTYAMVKVWEELVRVAQ